MKAKYDHIGKTYNETRKADAFLTEQLYYHLNPRLGEIYLDIGCGTGNYTSALQKKGISFIGVDPSLTMLNRAKEKNDAVKWLQGVAENIPLETESVAGVMGSLTLHHWTNLTEGFSEIFRVLKPHGTMVFFTSTPTQMKGYWLHHYFPIMMQDSIKQMPSLASIEKNIKKAGFKSIYTEKYNILEDLEDLFLYAGKQNPTLYLNPVVRSGISSFSNLANQKEITEGLTLLKKDIASGVIKDIIRSYENDLGDYLFILSQKEI